VSGGGAVSIRVVSEEGYNCVMSQAALTTIELRPNHSGQTRAYISGTRVRVQDIYALSELQEKTPDEIVAALPHLTLHQVHSALAYYFQHRDEILQEIREDEDFVAAMKAKLGPGPLAEKLKSAE
jgi:uncharacterized protein (DUF433 family)